VPRILPLKLAAVLRDLWQPELCDRPSAPRRHTSLKCWCWSC